MLGRIILSMGLLLAGTSISLAQLGANSTNGYTAAQRAKAEAAAKAAGFTVTKLADVQAGAIFLYARKEGRDYFLTITPDGTVHVGGVALPTATPPDLKTVTAQ